MQSLSSICKLKTLVVLCTENFKLIEDYSPLSTLSNLQELTISSGTLQRITIKDLEFLREMPNLLKFGTGATTIRRKYTKTELDELRAALPNLKRFFVNRVIV